MKPKVIVITTGGTIAMKYDLRIGGTVPAVSGADLVEAVPGLEDICSLEVYEFANIPSPHMTPDHMFRLSGMVRQKLADPNTAGIVITHGTDTLEETAYFLDLTVGSDKPVCLTAAMRSAEEIGPDGPRNILCAVRTAVSEQARGKGVLVVLNEEIHAAQEVMKTHSANPAAFQSPWWGPIGYVDEDRVLFRRTPEVRIHICPEQLCRKVDVIKTETGSDASYVDFALSQGVDGLVLEGFGRGNIPPDVVPGVERALRRNVPVVITTRAPGGRALGVYGYIGGGQSLQKKGAILGGELSAAKARLKLLLVLSLSPDVKPDITAVAAYFGG